MRPEERENRRYTNGSQNPIKEEELIMFSLLPRSNGKKLLDVGCGIGTISLELQKRDFQVTGIDFSEVAIEKCRQKGLDAIISDVDRDGLKFPDNSFDVVWAGDVIEHVFDPIFLFEEIYRVLKDDGSLLVTVPNDFPLRKRRRIFLKGKSIQSNIYRKARQCKHHTFFSWELFEYMLKTSKFSVNRYYSTFKIPWTKIERTTSNRAIGRWFGRIFIVDAHKLSASAR